METYTYGPYTITKGDFRWAVKKASYELPGIWDEAAHNSESPDFQVDWSSMGSKTPEFARDYAMQIMVAADAAAYFNKVTAN